MLCALPSRDSPPSACSRHLVEREGRERRPSVADARGRSAPPRGQGARGRMSLRFFLSSLDPCSSAAGARGSSLRSRPRATAASRAVQLTRAPSVLLLGGDLPRVWVGVP